MAKIRILIDTDIMIDSIKGVRAAKELFRTKDADLYCSILTKKELLSKGGLKDSETVEALKIVQGTLGIYRDVDAEAESRRLRAEWERNVHN
jgi:predicted nucleic acid-binding protein